MIRRLRFRYAPGYRGAQQFHVEVKTGRFGRWRHVESLFIGPGNDLEAEFAKAVAECRDGFARETEVDL